MGTMITGWDKTGPQLYYVDNDATRLHSDLFRVGSGSTYAYGILDKYVAKLVTDALSYELIISDPYMLKCSASYYRFDLTTAEAIELGKRAIVHATYRDASSGGINNGTFIIHLNHILQLEVNSSKSVTAIRLMVAPELLH